MIHEDVCQISSGFEQNYNYWNKTQGMIFIIYKFYFDCFFSSGNPSEADKSRSRRPLGNRPDVRGRSVTDVQNLLRSPFKDLQSTTKLVPRKTIQRQGKNFLKRASNAEKPVGEFPVEGNDFAVGVNVVPNFIWLTLDRLTLDWLIDSSLVDAWLADIYLIDTWLVVDYRWRAQCFSGSITIMTTLKGTLLWRIIWRPSKGASSNRWTGKICRLAIWSVPSCL